MYPDSDHPRSKGARPKGAKAQNLHELVFVHAYKENLQVHGENSWIMLKLIREPEAAPWPVQCASYFDWNRKAFGLTIRPFQFGACLEIF